LLCRNRKFHCIVEDVLGPLGGYKQTKIRRW
jgi:hypothetical protein